MGRLRCNGPYYNALSLLVNVGCGVLDGGAAHDPAPNVAGGCTPGARGRTGPLRLFRRDLPQAIEASIEFRHGTIEVVRGGLEGIEQAFDFLLEPEAFLG